MLSDGKASFPGPPQINPDGTEATSYSDPRLSHIIANPEPGIKQQIQREMPPGIQRLSELGLMISGNDNPVPSGSYAKPYGFTVPPRTDKGGKKGSPLSRGWVIAIPAKNQDNLCHAATEFSKNREGVTFRKEDVIKALQSEKVGDRAKRKIADSPDLETKRKIQQERILEIDFKWLFASDDENGE
jgi:hypothetical protein